MENITIRTEFIKLDSFLKFTAAVGTGGEAKQVVADGMVTVNDQICMIRGKKLHAGDRVCFDNKEYLIEN